MNSLPQIRIPATYLRGGTSKGVFFKLTDLPAAAQQPGAVRDAILLRVIGSPDPYGKQIDGMGGATSSTSKSVILAKSSKPDHDVDYLFGQVSIDKPFQTTADMRNQIVVHLAGIQAERLVEKERCGTAYSLSLQHANTIAERIADMEMPGWRLNRSSYAQQIVQADAALGVNPGAEPHVQRQNIVPAAQHPGRVGDDAAVEEGGVFAGVLQMLEAGILQINVVQRAEGLPGFQRFG